MSKLLLVIQVFGAFSLHLQPSAFCQEITSDSVLSRSLVYIPSKYPIAIRQRANIDSNLIVYLHSVDSVVLLDYTGGDYYKVCLPELVDGLGYVSLDYLVYDQTAVTKVNTYNETHGKARRLTYKAPPKGYEKQQTNGYSMPQLDIVTDFTPQATKKIHTGPKGERYYYDRYGTKTYVKD